MVLCMKFLLVESNADNSMIDTNLQWSTCVPLAAGTHHIKEKYLHTLKNAMLNDGDLLRPGGVGERGAVAMSYNSRAKLTTEQRLWIVQCVDNEHAHGGSVTNRKLRFQIQQEFNILVSRSSAQRYLHKLGLSWKPTKGKKRTFKAHRSDAIRTYLVGLSKWLKRVEVEGDCVLVYMDESYVHQTHLQAYSYCHSATEVDKKSGKGCRLIMFFAITEHGPLCEYEEDGSPIDDLNWRGDTPHPILSDGHTAECLWMANSSTGDYHDNMNSDNFMRWVEERLVPTFESRFPGKKMILISDNAPHHHKREIGSLNSMSKKKLIDLAKEHGVYYLEMPLTGLEWQPWTWEKTTLISLMTVESIALLMSWKKACGK